MLLRSSAELKRGKPQVIRWKAKRTRKTSQIQAQAQTQTKARAKTVNNIKEMPETIVSGIFLFSTKTYS